MASLLEHPVAKVLIALAIGLLVGTERERRKADRAEKRIAGIRTYGLAGLLGGSVALFPPPTSYLLIAIGALFVGGVTIAGYVRHRESDVGATSEVALLATYVLGLLAHDDPVSASGIAMVMTAVLALRTRMHDWVRKVLTEQELLDALFLGIAAFVVLPILPDRAVGPFGGVHPPTLWRLVVVMMALSGAGYVAQRLVGARYGLPIAGLAGGFVSSSATIAAMGARAKADASVTGAAVAGAACSTISTIVQLVVVVGAGSRAVLSRATLPLAAAGAAAVVVGVIFALRAHATRESAAEGQGSERRPFQFKTALVFAALIGAVTLAAKLATARFGQSGLLVMVGLAGLADAHSAAASAASAAANPAAGAIGVLLALTTNSATKIFLAWSSGTRRFAFSISAGVLVVLAAAWAAFVISTVTGTAE